VILYSDSTGKLGLGIGAFAALWLVGVSLRRLEMLMDFVSCRGEALACGVGGDSG
jgi:hypothetical protein